MKIERHVVVSWSDLQAIVFECTERDCGARVVIRRDSDLGKTETVQKCPRAPHRWGSDLQSVNKHFEALKQHMTDGTGYRILLQFDEPPQAR